MNRQERTREDSQALRIKAEEQRHSGKQEGRPWEEGSEC